MSWQKAVCSWQVLLPTAFLLPSTQDQLNADWHNLASAQYIKADGTRQAVLGPGQRTASFYVGRKEQVLPTLNHVLPTLNHVFPIHGDVLPPAAQVVI